MHTVPLSEALALCLLIPTTSSCPRGVHVHHEAGEQIENVRGLLMSHLTLPLRCAVPLNPECVFGKSLKMAVGGSKWGWAFHRGGGSSRGCNALTGIQNHSCLWCSLKPLKAAVWSVRDGAWRKCDSIHCGNLLPWLHGEQHWHMNTASPRQQHSIFLSAPW